ncbi:MAG: phospholipase D-like domain-containing protein [Candidatus Woesearchaeota archaeon]
MNHITKKNTKYYSTPPQFYKDLLRDISKAKESVMIETHKLQGEIAKDIKEELLRATKRGVKVKLLPDHWGSPLPKDFFKELKEHGADIKFFRVFKFTTNIISYNNRRDHRKIIIIDKKITYIGSANLTDYCKTWREFIIRIEDEKLSQKMIEIFEDNFKLHNFFLHSAKRHIKPIKYESLEIVRDVPSLRFQKIRNKHLHLIRRAKKEIIIETPYFVPDLKTILALRHAAKKGVTIKLIMPKESDVKIVDVFTQSLFGQLNKRNIKIYFYSPGFSHAKLSLIDNKLFSFGSANFDYRSFRYQYEITLFGDNPTIKEYVHKHLTETLKNTKEFNHAEWRERPLYKRILEIIIEPFKHFL